MDIFLSLLAKLIPLYFLIGLGYIAGKYLKVDKESLAKLLIYIISPVVVFYGVIRVTVSLNTLSIPLVYFFLGSLFCLVAYKLSALLWHDTTKNIFAYSAGSGNTGYFGLPIAMMLFSDQVVGLYIMGIMGVVLYENFTGFLIVARGKHSLRESLHKIANLPSLYTFFLGLLWNFLRIPVPEFATEFITQFRGAYTILGMMMIGIGLVGAKIVSVDKIFLIVLFFVKFLLWPLVTFVIIFIDSSFFHFFSHDIYQVMLLLSFVPLPANSVAMASLFDCHPEKISVAVVGSTMFALLYLPIMVTLFIH